MELGRQHCLNRQWVTYREAKNSLELKATPSPSAKTGDALPIAMIATIVMLSAAVLLVSRTRTRKPVRGKRGR